MLKKLAWLSAPVAMTTLIRHITFLLIAFIILEKGFALDWQTAGQHRWAHLEDAGSGKPGFTLMDPARTGVQFTNTLSARILISNKNLLNGSGVAMGDYDSDGLCDIYLCRLDGDNALYRNLGEWKFENVTATAGIACSSQFSTGATFADVDGDQDLDLIVTAMGKPNRLFQNQGNGKFRDVTDTSGIGSRYGSSSIALADIDGDSDLDLYVVNYGAKSVLKDGGKIDIVNINGKLTVRGPFASRIKFIENQMFEYGEPDEFFLNDGNGKFTKLDWTNDRFLTHEGKPLGEPYRDQGLSAIFRDINGDRSPDLFVANDGFTKDRCWINDGQGNFREISPLAIRQLSFSAMGVDFADINRDGYDDFFVVEMLSRTHSRRLTQQGTIPGNPIAPGNFTEQPQSRRNCLYINRGDGTFAETAYYSGVAASEWSWSSIFLDVDLDGWEDILVTNGFEFDTDDLDTQNKISRLGKIPIAQKRKTIFLFPPLDTPNVAFRNLGNGRFDEVGTKWGFNDKHDGNGMALGDLDNDGDLDGIVNCLKGPALIYKNNASAPRVAVRLIGDGKNTEGTGARIRVINSLGQRQQSQEIMAGGRYVSGDQARRTFAAKTGEMFRIEVDWVGNTRTTINNATSGRLYEIRQKQSRKILANKNSESTLFVDSSSQLNHNHISARRNDFEIQPSLPKSLNHTGPFLSANDIDKDGDMDLLVTDTNGPQLSVLLNDGNGKFTRSIKSLQTAGSGIIIYSESQTQKILHLSKPPAIYKVTNGELQLNMQLNFTGNPSAAAAFDIEGDGDMDLFIGGESSLGQFPIATSAVLFINENGKYVKKLFPEIGIVKNVEAGDIDNDGDVDLVLAREWNSIALLLNENGQLKEKGKAFGLKTFKGLWQDAKLSDIDGNGTLDIIASNIGLNTAYELHRMPIKMLYGDTDADDIFEVAEVFFDPHISNWKPIRKLEVLSSTFPQVRGTYTRNQLFAGSNATRILGPAISEMKSIEFNTRESAVFLNNGSKFTFIPLPPEAQLAPAFGICAKDFNGDNSIDLFIAQNDFSIPPRYSRYDSGRGLLLTGDGKGNFSPLNSKQSGIMIYGEQRGAVAADFNGDKKLDLVVSQRDATTKLYLQR